MKAAVLYEKEDLRIIEDFEEPVMGDDDVLIGPKSTGLCSTDRSLYRGFVPFKPPLILGHEISGTIKEVGSSVDSLAVGDHVIIPPVYPGCDDESCAPCREGLTNRCKRSVFIGHGVHGGNAELIAAPARYSFLVDKKVPLDEVCIVPDAVSTPFHALKSRSMPMHILVKHMGKFKNMAGGHQAGEAKGHPEGHHWLNGKNVVVFGVGGVGGPTINLAAKYFKAKNVVAVDIFDNKLELAGKLGATQTVNSSKYFEDNGIELKELGGRDRSKALSGLAKHISSHLAEDKFQVDLVMDCSGVPDTFAVGIETVSKNRTLVQVGWPPRPVAGFLNQKVMDKYLTITGTWACPMNEMTECVEAVEAGLVDLNLLVTNKDYSLDQFVDAIHDLEAGKILGRATISIN
ncbi:MAG: alcohol dehydrogenase catalytic domain-containing protein [Thermoplasmata archaeon]|nr:alcohol dehydrogenase catalytic domain-containing protein [Thermoplasmata archaeon]